MLPRERLEIIKDIAKRDKKLYVSKLSGKFEVTEETIRRDLEKLEKEGLVTRTYGGAILNSNVKNDEIQFPKRIKKNKGLKKEIALKVLKYITPGITLASDSSTTVLELLNLIKERNDVTVITNSVEALMELSNSYINVLASGGILKHRSKSLQGSIAKNTLLKYNVDIALMSCKAVDMKKGILESNEGEAEIKKIMKKQADTTILLVDHTKFNKSSLVKTFDFNEINIIVTDEEPGEEWKLYLKHHNVELVF